MKLTEATRQNLKFKLKSIEVTHVVDLENPLTVKENFYEPTC